MNDLLGLDTVFPGADDKGRFASCSAYWHVVDQTYKGSQVEVLDSIANVVSRVNVHYL